MEVIAILRLTGNELHVCHICTQSWKDDWNRRTYSVFLFVATYVLPVLLVLTAYVRMSCRLCTPSVVTNNQDGKTNDTRFPFLFRKLEIMSTKTVRFANQPNRRRYHLEQRLAAAPLSSPCSADSYDSRNRFRSLLDAI